MIGPLKSLWSNTTTTLTQAATNTKVAREVLRLTIYFSLLAIGATLWQTFAIIRLGQFTAAIGTLLGGIFTFFGGILSVAIPAFVAALNASDKPVTPPPPAGNPSN